MSLDWPNPHSLGNRTSLSDEKVLVPQDASASLDISTSIWRQQSVSKISKASAKCQQSVSLSQIECYISLRQVLVGFGWFWLVLGGSRLKSSRGYFGAADGLGYLI
jgi:hypothetical protein